MSEANGFDTTSVSSSDTSLSNSTENAPTELKSKTSLPADTPESLAAMKKAAHLKFDEATKYRKEAEAMKVEAAAIRKEALNSKTQIQEFIELTKTDPRKLEQIYGKEAAKKIAEELLYAFYEEEKLSPQELSARQKKEAEQSELEQFRRDHKERLENETKTKRETAVAEYATEIDTMIADSISEHGLTATPKLVKRMAEYMEAQIVSGEEIDPRRIVAKVHEELHNDVVGYLKDMSVSQMVEEFPTLVKRVREFDMRQNEAVPNFQTGFAKPKADSERGPQPFRAISIDEAFKSIGKSSSVRK